MLIRKDSKVGLLVARGTVRVVFAFRLCKAAKKLYDSQVSTLVDAKLREAGFLKDNKSKDGSDVKGGHVCGPECYEDVTGVKLSRQEDGSFVVTDTFGQTDDLDLSALPGLVDVLRDTGLVKDKLDTQGTIILTPISGDATDSDLSAEAYAKASMGQAGFVAATPDEEHH